MIFEGLNCPFSGIHAVIVGLDELKFYVFFIEKCLIAWEATLSMMLNCGRKPRLSRYLMFSVKVSIMELSEVLEIGVAKIAFDDQS